MRTKRGVLILTLGLSLIGCARQAPTSSAPCTDSLAIEHQRLEIDSQLRDVIREMFVGDRTGRCIVELYFLPRTSNSSILVLGRTPWYEDYAEKNRPLVSFCLENHPIFVYSGVDKYLRERRRPGYQSTEKTDTCSVFAIAYLDSAGVISRVPVLPPIMLFPERLPAAMYMSPPGVVPDSE